MLCSAAQIVETVESRGAGFVPLGQPCRAKDTVAAGSIAPGLKYRYARI